MIYLLKRELNTGNVIDAMKNNFSTATKMVINANK